MALGRVVDGKGVPLGRLTKRNVEAYAKAIIEKYENAGMLADAMLWRQIVELYHDKLTDLKKLLKT